MYVCIRGHIEATRNPPIVFLLFELGFAGRLQSISFFVRMQRCTRMKEDKENFPGSCVARTLLSTRSSGWQKHGGTGSLSSLPCI